MNDEVSGISEEKEVKYLPNKDGKYTTRKERVTGYLAGFGGSISATLVGMIATYFTDIGIGAALAASLLLILKLWDAVNDPIAAAVIEKVKFKKGKYIPWLKITTILLPILLIFKFATQESWPEWVKLVTVISTYIIYEGVFTFYDVPIFGMHLVRTNSVHERTSLAALGGVFTAIGMLVATLLIPVLQGTLGWTLTAVVFAVIQVLTTVWHPYCTLERFNAPKEEKITFKKFVKAIFSNKYLLIYYISLFISFGTATFQTVAMYFARWNLGDQNLLVVVMLVLFIPALTVGLLLPTITKKVDKFVLFYICMAVSAALCVVQFFTGYDNFILFCVIFGFRGIFFGGLSLLAYQFTADMVIYKRFKTGESFEAVCFSFQTFTAKLISAVTSALALYILAGAGFIEGTEVATQPDSAISAIWWCLTLVPAFGSILGLIGFSFYKLRDHDVQLMAKANAGEITKEEAESNFKHKF